MSKHNILSWKVSMVSMDNYRGYRGALRHCPSHRLCVAVCKTGVLKGNHSMGCCKGCSHSYSRSLRHHRLPMGTETSLEGDSEWDPGLCSQDCPLEEPDSFPVLQRGDKCLKSDCVNISFHLQQPRLPKG